MLTLSILIRSLDERKEKLDRLLMELYRQIENVSAQDKVEILVESDNRQITGGEKANILKRRAQKEYVCFIDDDDLPEPDYLEVILRELQSAPDILIFPLRYYEQGVHIKNYVPNCWLGNFSAGDMHHWNNFLHLMPHKRTLADLVEFPHTNHANDLLYSQRLIEHIRTEKKIEQPLYNYYK